MNFKSFKFLGMAAAVLLFGAVSCEEKAEIVEQMEKVPAITLKGNESNKVVIDPGVTEPVTVNVESRFSLADDLVISAKNGETWCEAAFEGTDKLIFTPKNESLDEDMTAVFTVAGKTPTKSTEVKIVYVPEEVEITVTRAKRPVELVPAIEFTEEGANNITLPMSSTEKVTLEFKTIFSTETLAIVEKDNKDWCTAAFEGTDKIVITPTDKAVDQDMTATFIVGLPATKANVLYKPADVKITVTRPKFEEPYVRLVGNDLTIGDWNDSYSAPATETKLTFKVETNQPKWYVNDMSYGDPWYTLDKTEGVNGEELTISIAANTSSDGRSGQLMFVYEKDGYNGRMLMLSQKAGQEAVTTYVKVMRDGQEIKTNYEYTFSKTGGRNDALQFSYETDGKVDIKMVKPGTLEDYPDSYDVGSIGICNNEPNTHQIILYNNTTGAERKMDFVFVDKAGKEYFRFKLTQKAE